jgi:hypothetical protein
MERFPFFMREIKKIRKNTFHNVFVVIQSHLLQSKTVNPSNIKGFTVILNVKNVAIYYYFLHFEFLNAFRIFISLIIS